MENSFVVLNGGATAPLGGLEVDSTDVDMVYVTVAGNTATAGVPATINCVQTVTGTIRNSVLVSGGASVDAAGCAQVTFEGNGADTDAGPGNTNVGAMQASWFTGANDFHLAPGHPFGDVATWKTGDPAKDYDGDARPGTDGTPDVAGADEP